ncbi:hypothetical protein CEUSTIGMA_g2687.t1 [Chlamydomonas eustigma]|uniref:Aminotransferase class V domain-containing protein n=1 Tax=Chlamydomonas eustigma TaxID=1157962 RepID=A0A250WX96_9CHLO|nr:hypothetical protein CEUSTIGMA_g2687.t1 [Chlamydomonas eustigma]|eukprot:GAX75242.1 hypothetical protein CEUSTIGMA_g2687.t1 [Chlamydomonas eustigma]
MILECFIKSLYKLRDTLPSESYVMVPLKICCLGLGSALCAFQWLQRNFRRKIPNESSPYLILREPTTEYRASNPKWLSEAAHNSRYDSSDTVSTNNNINEEEVSEVLSSALESMNQALTNTRLGSEACRDSFFCLDPAFTYLNHGSYGATFRVCMEAQSRLQRAMEGQPVKFMETSLVKGLNLASSAVARFVGASPSDLFPVTNATSAVNAVVSSVIHQYIEITQKQQQRDPPVKGLEAFGSRSNTLTPAYSIGGTLLHSITTLSRIVWRAAASALTYPWRAATCLLSVTRLDGMVRSTRGRGDTFVLMTNLTYPAVKSTIVKQASRAGLSVAVVQLGWRELTEPGLALEAVEKTVKELDGRILLAVLDHIISFPPIILPVTQMTAMCKKAGALVLIDGAHAVGQLPGLHVPSIGADFYTSNLHKWCCTPKGTAFLWCHKQHQSILDPPLTSHGFGLGPRAEFLWQGTADLTNWLAVPAALSTIQKLGFDAISEHNSRLVRWAAAMLVDCWRGPNQGVNNYVVGGQELGSRSPRSLRVIGGHAGRDVLLTACQYHDEAADETDEQARAGPPLLGGSGTDSSAACKASTGDSQADEVAGFMLAVQVPMLRDQPRPLSADYAVALHNVLRCNHKIEVPVAFYDGSLFVRISCQIYNTPQDYEHLASVIRAMMPT